MLATLVAGLAFFAARPVLRPAVLRTASACLCAAAKTVEPVAKLSFDEALAGVLAAAESAGSLQPVLETWLEQVDENFVPTLASKLEAVSSEEIPDMTHVAKLTALLGAIERRSREKFEEARDQLQDLLSAGEINAMDARLCKLIQSRKLDAGFLYVLFKNMDEARAAVRKARSPQTAGGLPLPPRPPRCPALVPSATRLPRLCRATTAYSSC